MDVVNQYTVDYCTLLTTNIAMEDKVVYSAGSSSQLSSYVLSATTIVSDDEEDTIPTTGLQPSLDLTIVDGEDKPDEHSTADHSQNSGTTVAVCKRAMSVQQEPERIKYKKVKRVESSDKRDVFGALTPTSLYNDENRLFQEWRREALDSLVYSKNVFVLETYTVNDFLLQVKISNSDVTMLLNTLPWSISFGKSVPKQDFFKTTVVLANSETDNILRKQSVDFSPSRLIRFIIENCEGIPIIVSSDFNKLMNKKNGNGNFMDYIVYPKLVPGSQICNYSDCKHMASAIHVGTTFYPKGIYCSSHVNMSELGVSVRLYNPLLCALTSHLKNVVLSAMDVLEVYGSRSGYWSALPDGNDPIPLPRKWIPLCRKAQPRHLKSRRPIDMIYETAENVLPCADEHHWKGKHTIGVDNRHSLSCCMLKTFLSYSGDNKLCQFSLNDNPTFEDLPYGWKNDNK